MLARTERERVCVLVRTVVCVCWLRLWCVCVLVITVVCVCWLRLFVCVCVLVNTVVCVCAG